MTNSVSSNDALIFLAGTNLGAAAYEYVLARLTHRLLRRGCVARHGLVVRRSGAVMRRWKPATDDASRSSDNAPPAAAAVPTLP
jgi:hypothetical protein